MLTCEFQRRVNDNSILQPCLGRNTRSITQKILPTVERYLLVRRLHASVLKLKSCNQVILDTKRGFYKVNGIDRFDVSEDPGDGIPYSSRSQGFQLKTGNG